MKRLFKIAWDFIGAPLRMILLPDSLSAKLGLTSLQEERIEAVLPYIRGELLDIGAGDNRLVKSYPGKGTGVDIYDLGGGALIVEDTRHLPFDADSFDTVTFVASLNHIAYRKEVLDEVYRLLRPDGRIIITMINPLMGKVGHFLWWYGEDRKRPVDKGEVYGMFNSYIIDLLRNSGFHVVKQSRFLYFLNNLIIAQKDV